MSKADNGDDPARVSFSTDEETRQFKDTDAHFDVSASTIDLSLSLWPAANYRKLFFFLCLRAVYVYIYFT